jgi:hypothetical protein
MISGSGEVQEMKAVATKKGLGQEKVRVSGKRERFGVTVAVRSSLSVTIQHSWINGSLKNKHIG